MPGDRAIGGRAVPMAPYAVPLFGGVVYQLPSSCTGGVLVTVGWLVMSAAVSDSRIRRLACENSRWPKIPGWALFSLEFCNGRRIRSIGYAPWVTSGRSSRLAPVRPFLMLLA